MQYAVPQVLLLIGLATTLISNVVHFKVNYLRLQDDEYVRKWQDMNVNHSFLVAARYIALCTHHKFFRIIYSKVLGSIHLSLVALAPKNVFFVSTVFTIICLLSSELLALVAAFYLAYNKLLKDQIFYSAV